MPVNSEVPDEEGQQIGRKSGRYNSNNCSVDRGRCVRVGDLSERPSANSTAGEAEIMGQNINEGGDFLILAN
jgi:hypothetical protein